jgi:hypothetical protein
VAPAKHVVLVSTLRNESDRPCSVRTGTCVPQVVITGRAGTVVWNRAVTQVMCTFGQPQLVPARRSVRAAIVWDGRRCAGRTPIDCPGTPVPGGTYRVSVHWQGEPDAAASLLVKG